MRKTSKYAPDAVVALELYRLALKIRLVEQKVVELYPSDKIQSPVHLSIGQEAVSAGTCRPLRVSDHIYGTYRGHGLYVAKGGDLRAMFAELYGKDAGCARGKGGSMHLTAPQVGLMGCSAIVASLIPVATGDALASQAQGRDRVVVAFFGDGALDEGVFFESVNFAVLKNLPILFVCENNHYAIHSKVSDRRKQTELFRVGEGLGLRGRRLDGNDVLVVDEAVSEAVEGIRGGRPPEMLEFMTYRWHEHVGLGVDYQEAYRVPGEEREARGSDPVARARDVLLTRFHVGPERLELLETQLRGEIEDAVQFAEMSPYPEPSRLREDLFAPLR